MSDDKKMPEWFKNICRECLIATGRRLDANQRHFLWTYITKPENLARIPEVKALVGATKKASEYEHWLKEYIEVFGVEND